MRRVLTRAATVAICCNPAALAPAPAPAQTPGPSPAPALVLIKAGRLIDGRADAPQSNVGILVEGERIKAVGPLAQVQGQGRNARVVDLSAMTILPGFIDTHTHLLLQGDPTAQSYNEQLLYQSTPYPRSSRRATRASPSSTALRPSATWRPRGRCMRTST